MTRRKPEDVQKLKEQFLKVLEKMPVIESACKKVGIHRTTYYKWRKRDPKFAVRADKKKQQSVERINDVAVHTVISKIREQDLGAAKYWLSHNSQQFGAKVPVSAQQSELSDSELTMIQSILKKPSQKKSRKRT